MQHRSFTWQVLSFLGAYLLFVGLVFIPSDLLPGQRADVLAIRAGFVAFLVGLLWGLVLAVQRLRRPGSQGEHFGWTAPSGRNSNSDGDSHRRSKRYDGDCEPRFNVDGTPMLTDGVDVMGKPYGDDGHHFDASSFSHGDSLAGDYGSFGNSRW